MMTRNPRDATSAAAPYFTQLVCALEKSPWIRMTDRPSPISCQASSTPSAELKSRVETSVGELAVMIQPLLPYWLMVRLPVFGNALGVAKRPNPAHDDARKEG